MTAYDFSVGDFGNARVWAVTARGGQSVGDLTGMVPTVKVVTPSKGIDFWTDGFEGLTSSRVEFTPPDSTYFDEEGRWTFHVRYTLGALTETLDPIEVLVGPSGGAASGAVAGATSVSALNAQIVALSAVASRQQPRIIRLPSGGRLTLGSAESIELKSHVWLEFPDDFVIDARARTGISPYDTPTVCAVKAEGTISTAKINTTLSGNHYQGDRTIDVVAAGTIAADDWVLIDTAYQLLEFWEMHQVASVAGNTITLKTGLKLEHLTTGSPRRVRQITPVENVRISGGYIDGRSGTLATGILLRGVNEFEIENVRGAGFTRSIIELDTATQYGRIDDCYCDGEANAYVIPNHGGHHTIVRGWKYNPVGLRQHASGYARHAVSARNGVVDFAVLANEFGRCNGGVRFASGLSLAAQDNRFYDLDPTRLVADGVTANEMDGTSDPTGIVFCGSFATIEWADFARSIIFSGNQAMDVLTPDSSCALQYHDFGHLTALDNTLENYGQPQASRRCVGAEIDDVLTGVFGPHTFRGVEKPLRIVKTPTNIRVFGWTLNGAQPGGNCSVAVEIALTPGHILASTLRDCDLGNNFSSIFAYAGGYTGDPWLELFDCKANWRATRALQFYASGASPATGAPCVPTSGGTFRRIAAAGAQARSPMVVMQSVTDNFVFCALPQGTTFLLVSGSGSYGDRLETDGAGRFRTSALTDDRAAYVALSDWTANDLIFARAA